MLSSWYQKLAVRYTEGADESIRFGTINIYLKLKNTCEPFYVFVEQAIERFGTIISVNSAHRFTRPP